MASLKDLQPLKHQGIYGGSGSGKSYLMERLHATCDNASIYFNYPQKEADEYDITGYKIDRTTSKKHIKRAVQTDMKLKYDAHHSTDVMSRELKALYHTIKSVRGYCHLRIDEAHLLDEDALELVFRDGRGHKVLGDAGSQRPKDVGTTVNSQIESEGEFKVFKLSKTQKSWFHQMSWPYEPIKEWTQQDHHFVRIRDGFESLQKCKPIPWNG